MKMEERKSGLVVPVTEAMKPEREFGAVEFENKDDRDKVYWAISRMMRLTDGAGMIKRPPAEDQKRIAQRALIRNLGELLLGGFESEEYT